MSNYFKVGNEVLALRSPNPYGEGAGVVCKIRDKVDVMEHQGALLPGWRGRLLRLREPKNRTYVPLVYVGWNIGGTYWFDKVIAGWPVNSFKEASSLAEKATASAIRSFEEATGEKIPTGE